MAKTTGNRSRDPQALLNRFEQQVRDQAEKATRIADRAVLKGDKVVARKATSLANKLRKAVA